MQGKEIQISKYMLIGPDGSDYNYSGVGKLYTSLSMSNTIRVYCQECHAIVARLEARGVCFHDITVLSPHYIPSHIVIPGVVDTQTALGFCFECCPAQHKAREEREQRRTPIIQ